MQEALNRFRAANPNRDILVLSNSINRGLHSRLTTALRKDKEHENCTIFLTTFGGDPHGGYRVARCIRHHYKHVRLVVPSYCKSAGTLIAIAANELAIGDMGELGPLDIQVSKPTELNERGSGLDILQALQMVMTHTQEAFRGLMVDIRHGARLSTKLAGEFASKIAVGVAEPLYSQIDPNRLGEMQRAMRITHEYGVRLNEYAQSKEARMDKETKNPSQQRQQQASYADRRSGMDSVQANEVAKASDFARMVYRLQKGDEKNTDKSKW